ncbi:hypothetical protein Moror_8011 [Moniliophthora roreri MCA 2997]|uniref:Uncharacterized protein n=2 Tax=Moniliophthora roreri TaxID=221103 RepID=V2YSA0_MONRO|nr:hypothetical protein Moror_8011 [Moniliophthora roreri MCA 2997]KAI3610512.1 hypothetical protein WG66_006886 [Moniliophthora roreri]
MSLLRRQAHRKIVARDVLVNKRQTGFTPTAQFSSQQAQSTTTSTSATTQPTTTPAAPTTPTTPTTHTTPTTPTTSSTSTSTTSNTAVTTPTTTTTSSTTPLIPPLISISTSSTSTSSTLVTTPTTPNTPTIVNQPQNGANDNPTPTTQARQQLTEFVTASRSVPSSVPSVSASGSPESSGSSGKTGSIAGGIFGAVVGLVAICVFVSFILRRYRKRNLEREASHFDAGDFRRSAVMLGDSQSEKRGHTPRPPSMVERRMQHTPMSTYSFTYSQEGSQAGYGATQQAQYPQQAYYGQQYNALSPPNSANPLMHNSPSPFSPGPVSPTSSYMDYGNVGPAPGQYLTRSNSGGSQGTRRLSAISIAQSLHNPHPPSPQLANAILSPTNEYIDATRSSVTPYQEAQYAAITQQLNFAPPQAPSPVVDKPRRSSVNSEFDTRVLDFPAPPPSPSPSSSAHTVPPTLPEIRVESRDSSDFSASVTSGVAAAKEKGTTEVTPSPLNTSVAKATESKEPSSPSSPASPSSSHPSPLVPGTTARPALSANADKRPDTVYEDGDAYGGM